MCGRFALFSNIEIIMKYADLIDNNISWSPHYNISPSMEIPVLIYRDESPTITVQKWGFVPDFVYKSEPKNKSFAPINVRSETIEEKPIFRNSFREKRCLIPTNGFYEWRKSDRQPFFIHVRDIPLFFFAGIWNSNREDISSQPATFAIITTRANKKILPIHVRMPVIVHPEKMQEWLSPARQDVLKDLMNPYPDEDIELNPVSKAVNYNKNNEDGLIKPVSGSK